ncbi:MAG: hypothetical protein ACI31C_08105 [Muribaculaceae bacterium]
MKKFYSFISIAFIAIFGLQASAQVTITLNIDNPDAVYLTFNYAEDPEFTLVAGDNVITRDTYTSVQVNLKSDYAFESILDENGTAQSVYGSTFYTGCYPDNEGKTFYIKTIDLNATRTASFTLTVDDPSQVMASLKGTSAVLTLTEGTTTYKFDPNVETSLYVASRGYKNLYKVTLNGEDVPITDSSVEVPLSDGCDVVVEAIYPEIPCNLEFVYDAENCPGLITSISVNYNTVEFDGKNLSVQVGDNVAINFNRDYKVDAITINGVDQDLTYFYYYLSFTPTEDAVINIAAHPYGTVKATVNVNEPAAFLVYKQYGSADNLLTLNAGDNEVELSENGATIFWKLAAGYELVSASSVVEGVETDQSENNYIDVVEGMTIKLEGKAIVLDKQFVFWVDDQSAAMYYFSIQNYVRDNYTVENGYTVIGFTDAYCPFAFGWAGAASTQLYLNNVLVDPLYSGGSTFNVTPEDGDVVKAYLAAEAVECSVAVTAEGEFIPGTTATVDILVPQELTDFTCLNGTQVCITPDANAEVSECTLNGEAVAIGEDGTYTFTITEASNTLYVKVDKESGISAISLDGNNANAETYNLQGIRVTSSNLPAGVYVRGGQKIIVK